MAPASLPAFKWSSLQQNETRVMTFLVGKHDDPFHVRLTHHALDQLPPYQAISYVVGTDEAANECVCEDDSNRGLVKITQNLWDALGQFRSQSEDVLCWCDQISIDQTNPVEKAQQIKLMSGIYSRAWRVWVWLGKADSETPMVYRLLYNLKEQLSKVANQDGVVDTTLTRDYLFSYTDALQRHPSILNSADGPEWGAFDRLLKRDWFSRLWVCQELVLAPEALMVCGEYNIDWLEFFFIVEAVGSLDATLPIGQHYLIGVSASVRLLGMCHLSLSPTWKTEDRIGTPAEEQAAHESTLLALMCNLMTRKTTVPHDKVYALLGLAQDIQPQDFVVDYTKPIPEVFAYVTRHFLQQYADMTVLKLVAIKTLRAIPDQEPRRLPSWVPDYQAKEFSRQFVQRSVRRALRHGGERLYNATGLSKAVVSAADDLRVPCQGLAVGTITRLSEASTNMTEMVLIGAEVLAGGGWSCMAETCAIDGIYPPTGEPIELAYARTRVEDFVPRQESGPNSRSRSQPLTHVPDLAPDFEEDALLTGRISITFDRIAAVTTQQKLFITDTGYMGLAHQSCVLGDTVYLLMGGDMPFILRNLSTGTYQFQGEAYVHGIMDGEFLLKQFRKQGAGLETMSDEEWLESLGDGPLPFPTETVTLS